MMEYLIGYITLTTLLILFMKIGNAEVVTGPRSTAVQVGSSAFFNCSTSLSYEIQWFHYTVGADDRIFVYGYDRFYAPYEGRFEMEKNGSAYNLIIPSTKFEDAGKYECQDNLGSGDKKSAQLTVLDQGPICQSDKKIDRIIGPNSRGIEPDDLLLTCTIQYRGNEVPILEWRNLVTNDVINKGIAVGSKDNSVMLNLTLKGDPSLDDITYLCQTIITTPIPYSCAIGPVKVLGTSDTACNPHVIVIVCISVLLVGCIIILCVVLIRYMATRRRKSASYVDINEIQPNALSRCENNAHRVAPNSPQRNDPTAAPLYESIHSSSNQHRLLPSDSHSYMELFHEDEKKNKT